MSSTQENFNGFFAAQATMATFAPTTINGRSVYKFNSASQNIPLHIRTGQQSFGNPAGRKKYGHIEFHGSGTITCRVYVDGVYVCDRSATMTEDSSKSRRIGLPVGTKGYTIDLEIVGDARIRAIESSYTPMGES